MVPAVADGILRRPQVSASALGLCDFMNCLDVCEGKKSALVEHFVIVYMISFMVVSIIIAIVVIIIFTHITNNMIVMWEVDVALPG